MSPVVGTGGADDGAAEMIDLERQINALPTEFLSAEVMTGDLSAITILDESSLDHLALSALAPYCGA